MTTFEQAASSRRAAPLVLVRIEGVGDADGQWTFCGRVPAYVSGAVAATYKPWLRRGSAPAQLPEETQALGGVAVSGAITLEIVDGVGRPGDASYDAVSALLRTDSLSEIALESDVPAEAGPTAGVVLRGPTSALTGIGVGSILHLGAEACRVTAVTGSTSTSRTVTLARGQLDTDRFAHAADSPVFTYLPNILGRRVRLLLGYDLTTYSVAEEREIGPGWVISSPGELSGDLASWVLQATSRTRYLDRLLCRRRLRGTIGAALPGGRLAITWAQGLTQADVDEAAHFADTVFFAIGDELVGVPASDLGAGGFAPDQILRALGGTVRQDLQEGAAVAQVMLADLRTGAGSFRYQQPGDESSSQTDLIQTEHPIPCALAVITSSAVASDGLAMSNYSAGSGNYSFLPVGFGLGVPVAEIDVASFLQIWFRHPQLRLPFLRVERGESGREWLEREILRPFGIQLQLRAGRLTAIMPQAPAASVTGTPMGDADVLLEAVDTGVYQQRLRARRSSELLAATVQFQLRTARGDRVELVFSDADFPLLQGDTQGFYRSEPPRIELEVPGAEADAQGSHAQFEQRALRLLWRHRRPVWEVTLRLDLSWVDLVDVGDSVALTLAQLPDERTGRRGWSGRIAVVTSKMIDVSPQDPGVELVLVSYEAAGLYGLVAPAAMISSVSTNTATCAANRYTDPAAPAALGLPLTDVAAFAVGDVVRLRALDGTLPATTPATQIVQSIGTNAITLDGNFGGGLLAGRVLVPATYDGQTTAQRECASYADSATGRLGAADTAEPYRYGEP